MSQSETVDLDVCDDLAKAWRAFADGPEGNAHALHDFALPAIVRGFIAINQGPATETMAIREAGFMPALYARFEGHPVRVTLVSSMGDVGISRVDEEYGYFKRLSIYDLSDFTLDSSALHAHQLKEAEPCRTEQRPLDPQNGEPLPSRWRMPPPRATRRSRRRRRDLDAPST